MITANIQIKSLFNGILYKLSKTALHYDNRITANYVDSQIFKAKNFKIFKKLDLT